MIIEKSTVDVKSTPEEEGSTRSIHAEGLQLSVFVQVLSIGVKLLLRINELKHLSRVPPFSICLYHDGIGFDLLDEFLCSLRKHT